MKLIKYLHWVIWEYCKYKDKLKLIYPTLWAYINRCYSLYKGNPVNQYNRGVKLHKLQKDNLKIKKCYTINKV